jgi:hypothetical protein
MIKRVFDDMAKNEKKKRYETDSRWVIIEKNGRLRKAQLGELPEIQLDNSEPSIDDGELEYLTGPIPDFEERIDGLGMKPSKSTRKEVRKHE